MTTYKRPVPGGVNPPEQLIRPQVGGGVAAPKTSAAAAFALVFGVAALVTAATEILSLVGLLLGVIGVGLGIVGLRMARRPGVTGKGVAVGGLVLSVLAVVLSLALGTGITYLTG